MDFRAHGRVPAVGQGREKEKRSAHRRVLWPAIKRSIREVDEARCGLFSAPVGMVRGASQGCIGAEDEQQPREERGMGFAEDMKGMRADAILVHSSRRGRNSEVGRG